MTKEQFIQKMKFLGWSDDYINEQLKIKEDAEKEGITVPYDLGIVEPPIIN